MTKASAALPTVTYCENPYDATRGVDLVLLATEWPEYLTLDWGSIREHMRGNCILDGRHVLDRELLASLGFSYLSFGRARHSRVTHARGAEPLAVGSPS